MQSSRSARAQSCSARAIASAGQQLAEQDDVGLHLAGAARAGRDPVLVEQRLHLLELEARAAARAARRGDRAVHLDHVAPSPALR